MNNLFFFRKRRMGALVAAFAERAREPTLLCVRVRVELAAGRERVVLGAGAVRARI